VKEALHRFWGWLFFRYRWSTRVFFLIPVGLLLWRFRGRPLPEGWWRGGPASFPEVVLRGSPRLVLKVAPVMVGLVAALAFLAVACLDLPWWARWGLVGVSWGIHKMMWQEVRWSRFRSPLG
jgi:hypothetical protein